MQAIWRGTMPSLALLLFFAYINLLAVHAGLHGRSRSFVERGLRHLHSHDAQTSSAKRSLHHLHAHDLQTSPGNHSDHPALRTPLKETLPVEASHASGERPHRRASSLPSFESFIQRAQSFRRSGRYFRDVEDMNLVYGLPDFVWLVLIAVLIVILFSAIVAMTICLIRPKPKSADDYSPKNASPKQDLRQPPPFDIRPPVPSVPLERPRPDTTPIQRLPPPSTERLPQDAPRPGPPPPSQDRLESRGRPEMKQLPLGMISRTPSADGLVPRSVRLSVGPAQSAYPTLAEATFAPQDMPAAAEPPPAQAAPAGSNSIPEESFRSAQSSGRISAYMTQIDQLISELDSQVKRGKPKQNPKDQQKPQEPDRPMVDGSVDSLTSTI